LPCCVLAASVVRAELLLRRTQGATKSAANVLVLCPHTHHHHHHHHRPA
jgi:hypothetical protein